MKEMSHLERLEATMKGEADRVAVFDFSCISMSQSQGYIWDDVRYDVDTSVEILKKHAKAVRHDMTYGPIEPNAIYHDLDMKASFSKNNYSGILGAYFETPEDIDSKELYDLKDSSTCPHAYSGLIAKTEAFAKAFEKDESRTAIANVCWGPFTITGFLRGVENLLMDTFIAPADAEKAYSKGEKLFEDFAEVTLNMGIDVFYSGDPTSSGDMIDIDTFRKYSVPTYSRIHQMAKNKYGIPSVLHICGNTSNLVPAIPDSKCDGFSFDYMNDLASFKEEIGDRVVLTGNIPPVDVIWKGTPDSIMMAGKKCIEQAGKGGRFMLASGCEHPRDTPLENAIALREAAEKYGKY